MKRLLITVENAEYQVIQSLKLNRIKRSKLREVFVEGIECIKQAIESNIEITRIIIKNINNLSDWGKNIIERYKDAKIIEMSNELYNKLTEKINPSEMLITAKVSPNTFDDIRTENPFLIVFDRPSDYGNLGSIIRSANAFKVDGIFIIGHGIDMYESKVIRASLGSIFFTKIVTVESIEILTEYIKKQKIKNDMEIIGTDSTGIVSVKDYKINRPIMVIIGNEAKGMSEKLKSLCDKIVKIPMAGNVNSLNVSCAATIIMWEIYKKST
ncbi:MAG: RNA methyltransferase [Treponema sp.]|jgi:TrmH family RNA methyltransferase|nr:RNA methyltransferase [Treponema sp.]